MPIPGGDVHHDAAGFDGAVKQRRNIGERQSERAAGEMKGVHSGQEIDKRTARTCVEVETAGCELAPEKQLSGQKRTAEHSGHAKPGEMALIAKRDSRD